MKFRGYDAPNLFLLDLFKQIEVLALDLQTKCSDLDGLLKRLSTISAAVAASLRAGSTPEQTK
jgi:hypothetical protein